MKYLKILGLAAIAAAALMAFAGSAAATGLYKNSSHTERLGVGSELHAVAESEVILHPTIGDIICKPGSTVGGTITNAGGAGAVKGSIPKESLTWKECNATVTTLLGGELEANWTSGTEASLTSTGTEVTVELFGSHCIFKTNNTPIGTLTGSTNTGSTATFDISAVIPRTGGRSGALCGKEAQWTGSYSVDGPDFLDATSS